MGIQHDESGPRNGHPRWTSQMEDPYSRQTYRWVSHKDIPDGYQNTTHVGQLMSYIEEPIEEDSQIRSPRTQSTWRCGKPKRYLCHYPRVRHPAL